MTTRKTFLDQAVATLRREVPEDLEWLPWRELPRMRWADDRAAVDERLPRGWLVMAALRGQPEPDSDLRERAAMFDRGDAETLGAWLVREWIRHDTARPELTEARRQELRTIAERAAKMAERFGRGGTDPEERYRQLLAQEGARAAPSALPHQGLLAVAAACAGGDVAGDVESYLSQWHEERPAQCRALLRMLSWIDAPTAEKTLSAARSYPELRGLVEELVAARNSRQ